jgi:hypothetical protein
LSACRRKPLTCPAAPRGVETSMFDIMERAPVIAVVALVAIGPKSC